MPGIGQDFDAPVTLAYSPTDGQSGVDNQAYIVLRIVEMPVESGNMIANSTINVTVYSMPLGDTEYDAGQVVIVAGAASPGSGWENSTLVALVDGQEQIAADYEDQAVEIYVSLIKDTPHAYGVTYKIVTTVEDTLAQSSTTTTYCQIEEDPIYGTDTGAVLDTILIQDQMILDFNNSSFEKLRLELFRGFISTDRVGNWETRATKRLLQALSRTGRTSFLKYYWNTDPLALEGPVHGAASLSDAASYLSKYTSLADSCVTILQSKARVDSSIIKFIEKEADLAGKYRDLVYCCLVFLLGVKVRFESSSSLS
jgi:hypothetical protein